MSFAYRSTVGLRRVFTRRPWVYWVIVVAVAAVLATATRSNLTAVNRTRESWGVTATVWVATSDITPGQSVIGASHERQVPRAMVPVLAVDLDGSGTGASGDTGTTARQHISEGEIITTVDLTVTDGQLALVPSGWLAVVVTESPRSGSSVGARVQLASDGVVIAAEALVIGDVDGSTLVAVPEDVAPLVPLAAESGSLTVLRVP